MCKPQMGAGKKKENLSAGVSYERDVSLPRGGVS